jgi:hypothetical protein
VPTYQVRLHREAEKALPALPTHIRNAAYECLEQILPNRPLERIPAEPREHQIMQRSVAQAIANELILTARKVLVNTTFSRTCKM